MFKIQIMKKNGMLQHTRAPCEDTRIMEGWKDKTFVATNVWYLCRRSSSVLVFFHQAHF